MHTLFRKALKIPAVSNTKSLEFLSNKVTICHSGKKGCLSTFLAKNAEHSNVTKFVGIGQTSKRSSTRN